MAQKNFVILKWASLTLLRTKTVLATKLGRTILELEDGSILYIATDTFYPEGMYGFWQLKWSHSKWEIKKFLAPLELNV